MAKMTTQEAAAEVEKRKAALLAVSKRNWRLVMSNEAGRAVIFEILDSYCGLRSLSIRDPQESYRTAFNEGQRSIAVVLEHRLQHELREHYLSMMREAMLLLPAEAPETSTDTDD